MESDATPIPTELLDAVDTDLRAVEATLGRIDAGSYGRCDLCGGDIEAEVLAAAPLTRACSRHDGSDQSGSSSSGSAMPLAIR